MDHFMPLLISIDQFGELLVNVKKIPD